MSSFNYLLSRVSLFTEMAKGGKGEKNIKKNLPPAVYNVFKSASNIAKTKGGIPTREGKKAAIIYIKDYVSTQIDLDIDDEKALMRFTNIPAQEPLINFLETTKPQGSDLTYAEMLKNITDEDIEAINTERQRDVEGAVSTSMNRGEERQQIYDIRAAEIELRRKEKEEFKQMAQAARAAGDSELEGVMDNIGNNLETVVAALEREQNEKTVRDSVNMVLDELENEIMDAEPDEYGSNIYKALANVREIVDSKVTTVEQLQILINQISKMEGYQEIAYALSAAVKGIKSTTGEEEAEDDVESYYDPSGVGVSPEEYDEVMSNGDEESDSEEIVNIVGYPHIVKYGSSGEVVSVTTKEPGSNINIDLVNKYISSGFDLTRAIAAATSHPNDPGQDEEGKAMLGESYTSMYLVEQIKKDSLYKPNKEKTITFKNKFKPKTSYQLEELRRYGL